MDKQARTKLIFELAVMILISGKVSCWKFSSILELMSDFILSSTMGLHFAKYQSNYVYNYFMQLFKTLILLLVVSFTQAADIQETIACIKNYIDTFKNDLDPTLYTIFKKSYPNTLETTVQHYDLTPGKQSTYIITGDIEAMWLRDSTNQFLPYIRTPSKCPNIQSLSRGLLNTQAEFIMTDGYTNAFKRFETDIRKRPSYLRDRTETLLMGILVDLCRERQFATPAIWQRKFQIDSLASFLRLAYEHYRSFQNIDFVNLKFIKALKRIVTVLEEQTHDEIYEAANNSTFYTFYRDARELVQGHIKPSRRTGMVKTGFRPSDDPNQLAYNIPGNAMASTYLMYVAEFVLERIPSQSVFYHSAIVLSNKMKQLSIQIHNAIYDHGVIKQLDGSSIFAYEVDGMGNYKLYDDANLPSLLSLPYFNFVEQNNPIYQATRSFLLSSKNRYFYQSGNIKGIGSSHTNNRYIWPLALMTQIMTSDKDAEISNCLESLILSAKNDLMHESFSVDNPKAITRDWFAWANSFFGETVVYLHKSKKHLLKW